MILMTLFVLKVSWISMEKMSGETLMILNLSIVEVSPKKLIMEIHNGIKIIRTTLFLRKVSWMTMKKPTGETVMIMKITMKTQSGDSVIMMMPATVRVSPIKLTMEIHSRMKMILTTLFVLKVSRMTM